MASKAVWAAVIIVIVVIAVVAGYLATMPGPAPTETSPTTTSSPSPTTTTPTTTTTTPTETTPTTTPTETTPTATTPTTTTAVPGKKILRVGFSWPTYIDPAIGSDYSSSTAFTQLYDPLVWPTPEGDVIPWVATEWTVSDDGLVWTFKIRPGIKFHSGRELTAEDVAFTMKRLLTIGQGYAYLFLPYVEDAVALDKYTVQFKLKKPFGPFLICLVRLYIVDKEEVLAHIKKPGPYGEYGDFATEWMLLHDAGSGPYMVKEVKLEEYVHMVKFPDYWNKEAVAPNAPDEVIFLPTAGAPSREVTMLAKRELEIGDQWLPEEIIQQVDKIEGVDIALLPQASEFYLMLNVQKPPLDDVHVRRALAYAFDYETVVRDIFPDCPLAVGPVPQILPGWCSVPQYKRDLNKAIEELKKSKYYPDIVEHPDKYEIEFWWVADVPAEERVALLFAKCAAEIGLKVKVVKNPWSKVVEYMAQLETSPHIVSIFVAAHYPEAGSLLESRYHSKSAPTWEQNEWLMNETVDALIEKALSTIDREERFKLYCELQKMAVEQCWSLFLFDQVSKFPYQSYYVDWPQAKDPSKVVPVMGYNIDCKQIQVYPDKRAELLQGG